MAKTRRASALATSPNEDRIPEPPWKKVKLEVEETVVKTKVVQATETDVESSKTVTKTTTGKRKTKASEVEIDKSVFLKRASCRWKVGAHVSSSGGVENAVVNAATIGANAFALFVKSQRKWVSPPLAATSIELFKSRMEEYGYTSDVVLPHGSYLINLGNPDAEKREKSYQCFLDDLKRCESLGLKMFNFHPGSTVGQADTETSLSLIAECLNRAHKETSNVITVLENMAGAGNVIGGDFAHLKGIIDQVEDKSRVGVCMDTCHAFAAGYDIRTRENWEETISKFDSIVGISYLRGMHLNDSKAELGTKKDRHENIGLGHLTLSTFTHILHDTRTQGIPLILETASFEKPKEVWGKEIEVLARISGDGEYASEYQSGNGIGEEEMEKIKGELEEAVKAVGWVKTEVKPAKGKKGRGKKVDEDEEGDECDGEDEAVKKPATKPKKAAVKKAAASKKGNKVMVEVEESESEEDDGDDGDYAESARKRGRGGRRVEE